MHLAGILGVYISYSNSVVLSIGTIYRFDGSGNEIKLAKLPVLQLMFRSPSCCTSIPLICSAGEQSRENGDAFTAAVEGKMHHKKLQLPHPCSSHYVTAPSTTLFDVSLTGAFTGVTTDHEE